MSSVVSVGEKVPTEVKNWHAQEEIILKHFAEQAACYRYIHFQSFLEYKKYNQRATLPVIILSTVTGTASFAMESFPEELRPVASQSIGAMNLIAGLIATISTFLKLAENTQAHKQAAYNFGKFSRKIRLQLSLPLKDREKDGAVMIDECRAEYDRLLEEAPDITRKQLEAFEYTFPGNELYKPEILQLHPVKRYGGIREFKIMNALKYIVGDSPEKKRLKRELEQIRKAGEGYTTAYKQTTMLKRNIFKKQTKEIYPVTPVASDDEEDDDLDSVVIENPTPVEEEFEEEEEEVVEGEEQK